jgi:cellulose synthase/poly-beta-1,6-N-acetylglucosamine synthase-like glycosyltransferase
MKSLVSVIVPCRNEEKSIKSCLEAILENDYGSENIEIIVVDGLSTDNSVIKIKEVLADHTKAGISIISNRKMITPVSFNLGIKASKGSYILIVGARHILSKNYISTCLRILNDDSQIGCVGSVGDLVFDSVKSEMIAYATSSSFGVGLSFRNQSDTFVDTVGIPLYRRNIFEQIGYFDENLVRNQDDELNYRVRKSGYKIYVTSETRIKYYVRTRFKDLFKQYYQYGYWKVFVNRKHKTITTFRQVIPVLFVLFVVIGLIGSIFLKFFSLFYFGIIILYLCTGLFISSKKTWKLSSIIQIMISFIILHSSYGIGYLNGILDFLVFDKKPGTIHTTLSR